VHGDGLKLAISSVSEEVSEWQKELGPIRIGGRSISASFFGLLSCSIYRR
jgi:hypothetical protein